MAPQVPSDPGTTLQDGVDFVYLAGLTGLHARFLEIYKTLNPAQRGIGAVNMDMTSAFDFLGSLLHNGLELVGVLSNTTGINGKNTGTTSLLTVPSGKTAVIVGANLRLTTATAITGTMIAGIGVAALEEDIFPATSLIGFNATKPDYVFNGSGARVVATAGQIIKLGIDTAFGGTTATMEVQLLGYYR